MYVYNITWKYIIVNANEQKNGLIQDEADLWQNCLSNINNNSLIQDKNDINSSLVDVRIPA